MKQLPRDDTQPHITSGITGWSVDEATEMGLQAYDMVRVTQLLSAPEQYDGWGVNLRPPRVGDIGTVLNILAAPGLPLRYVVECSLPDGATVWLSDFQASELEPVERD